MNKLIKLILQFKQCDICNDYHIDFLFEEIFLELELLIKSYIIKVPNYYQDDFKQELLSCLYNVLTVFNMRNNIDDVLINNIKMCKNLNLYKINEMYNDKYFKKFIDMCKNNIKEYDYTNADDVDLIMEEFNLFCNENQFIKYLNISLKRQYWKFNSALKKDITNKPISLNLLINDEIEFIDLIKDETKKKKIFDKNLLSKKDIDFLTLFIEGDKILKGIDVARKLGITQQAVSIRLKRIKEKYLKKYYQLNVEVEI